PPRTRAAFLKLPQLATKPIVPEPDTTRRTSGKGALMRLVLPLSLLLSAPEGALTIRSIRSRSAPETPPPSRSPRIRVRLQPRDPPGARRRVHVLRRLGRQRDGHSALRALLDPALHRVAVPARPLSDRARLLCAQHRVLPDRPEPGTAPRRRRNRRRPASPAAPERARSSAIRSNPPPATGSPPR